MLDYDRVFSAMGIPACLWRRTGEIYKGNREFAELVGLDDYMLRDVSRNCFMDPCPCLEYIIGSIMYIRAYVRGISCKLLGGKGITRSIIRAWAETRFIWQKYGHVAFDSTQKAVLTSCVLRYRPTLIAASSGYATPMAYRGNRRLQQPASQNDGGFVNCCFSFTIRRDMWGIPSMIVGNFIKC